MITLLFDSRRSLSDLSAKLNVSVMIVPREMIFLSSSTCFWTSYITLLDAVANSNGRLNDIRYETQNSPGHFRIWVNLRSKLGHIQYKGSNEQSHLTKSISNTLQELELLEDRAPSITE